ncbi:hypothetical protein ACIRBZ_36040 [Streptomyces sp. NPDC094038]|uniref:hypothetical protein n=1 Tax=Streptomyces sp. NPDC094038 TaxID=3366055 RepID=UPI00381516AF
MWHIEARDGEQMQIFLLAFSDYLAEVGGRADVDLIVADPAYEKEAKRSLDLLKSRALERFAARNSILRRISGTDPLMGYDIDVNDIEERAAFSQLAHRTIHAEAWEGNRQLLCSVESDTSMYIDMDAETLMRIISETRKSGVTVKFEEVTPA